MLSARRAQVKDKDQTLEFTGNEALWAVDAQASDLKEWMRVIEEEHPLGRLFDIDVLDERGAKLSREGHRQCLICGGDVHACARSRAHSADELFIRAREMIADFFAGEHARFIGMCARTALLYETVTTPKPGLVDAADNGAHSDMNLFSFMTSASALGAWFEKAARIGMTGISEGETFARLRAEGMRAEQDMLRATLAPYSVTTFIVENVTLN
jgi:holo-ACP synthase/triphosphoribosyl-dephospho-CoA synthase